MHRDLEINVNSSPFQSKNKNEKPSPYLNYFNHRQNIVTTFTKLSKIDFFLECFTADYSQSSEQLSKTVFQGVGWVLTINSKHCKGLLEIS